MPIGSKENFDIGSDKPSNPVERDGSWRRGLRRMTDSDAFELSEDAIDFRTSSDLLQEERRALRKKLIILVAALVVLFFLSLSISVSEYEYYSPLEVLSCLGLRIQMFFQDVFTTATPLNVTQAMEIQPHYYEVMTRFGISLMTVICGVLLALAGTLYQNVFRNPIAAPTMLGVSSGINMGLIALVLLFQSSASYMTGYRYLFCYGGAILVLLVVMLSGRAVSGRRSFSVVDMLLVGSIISQLLGTVTTYIGYFYMDDTLWEVYYLISEQIKVNTEVISYISLFTVFVVGVVPIFLLRFSLNAMSFSDTDSKFLGVNANRLRFISLVCGSIMVIAAQIHCGMIAMVSLVVPHLSRFLFGAEFKKQFFGNILIGALLLLFCRNIAAMIPFLEDGLPIGTVVSFVTMPIFVWMLAIQQRSWE